MKNLDKFTFLLRLLSGFVLSLDAQSNSLNLEEFLSKVKQNDPGYKELSLQLEKDKYFIDQKLPSRSFLLNVENENGFASDGEDTKLLSATLAKEIFESGTALSASYKLNNNPDQDVKLTELRLEQSLLKNFLGKRLRLQKSSLERQREVQRLKSVENMELFLGEKIKLYLDFTRAASDLETASQLFNESIKLYNFISDKFKKNAANQTDLKRVTLQKFLREEELLEKQIEYEGFLKKMASSSGIAEAEIKSVETLSVNKKYPFQVKKFKPESFRQYHIALENKNASDFEMQIANRDSYPRLNLVAGYNIDNSTRFSSTVDRNETVLGFNLTVPFGDTKSGAQSELSSIELSKAKNALARVSSDLKVSYLNLKEQLKKTKKRVELSKKKVQLMSDILKEDNRRYRVGKIDLDKIIEANNDYSRFQLQYSQNYIEYNRVYIDWLVFNDQLIK